ncbi:MAG: maltose ABC transporter permease [Chloroflexi bacterium HGW-Chloroflexi-10]|nr:MAG: maltose ABC transporter permease [Chloroflexi bacterium HGW-Chloroflexi-10]
MSNQPNYIQNLRTSKGAQRKFFGVGIRLVIAVILIIFSIFPVLWMISASLSPTGTLATQSLIPKNPGFGNYLTLVRMDQFPFWNWLLNSLKIASITSVTSLAITTLAGYAFSRFRFRGRQTMLKAILLINTFPSLLALVATFLMVSQMGDVLQYKGQDIIGLDNHFTLILVYLGGSMGINIWLMKGYLDTIPRDIDESAMVEGASYWQIFTMLILPLLRPMLVVIAIINFIGTYGEFVLARVLLRSNETYTLMVGLQIFAGAQFQQRWGVFAAGALMGALPIIIIYLVLQDHIVSGLTQGAVKG